MIIVCLAEHNRVSMTVAIACDNDGSRYDSDESSGESSSGRDGWSESDRQSHATCESERERAQKDNCSNRSTDYLFGR